MIMNVLKTFVFQMFVYGYPMETAMFSTPVLYAALPPALQRAGPLGKMRT